MTFANDTDLRQTAQEIMGKIRYQIFAPEGTTMRRCSTCELVSHGADSCYACLTKGLGYIVGTKIARDYTNACLAQRECELRVYEAVEYGK